MENATAPIRERVFFPLSWSLLSLALGIATFLGNLVTRYRFLEKASHSEMNHLPSDQPGGR